MDQETRCRDQRTGGDDEHADGIDSRANDFHELSKSFHERLSCRKRQRFSILFLQRRLAAFAKATACQGTTRSTERSSLQDDAGDSVIFGVAEGDKRRSDALF